MSIVQPLITWIRRDCRLTIQQVTIIRIVFGLFACYAGSIFIEQYWSARNGQFVNLPIIPFFQPAPAWLHKTILACVFLLGVGVTFDFFAVAASLLLSFCFAYIITSDFFGFRPVWVLLGNMYLLLALVLPKRPLYLGKAGADDPCLQQYALGALRVYIALAYLLAAVAKMNAGFLSGSILKRLAENWGEESIIKSVLDAPLVATALAVAALVTEIVLPVLLLVRPWRPLAVAVGVFFHNAVPFIGWVGHSLNFYFIGSYLFFHGQPPATSSDEKRSASRFVQGIFIWYGLIWLLMLALKVANSGVYVGALLVSTFVFLTFCRQMLRPTSHQAEQEYWREEA